MTKPQATSPDSSVQTTGKRPKRRWLRRIVFAVVLLVVVLVVLVVLAPTILSSGSSRAFVLGVVNDQIVGRVEADGLKLSWGGGQSLAGVVVRDVDGKEVARIGRVELPDATLLALARGKLSLGRIEIEQVTGDIVGYEDGTTNLQRAMAMRNPQPGTPSPTQTTTGTPGADWPKGLSFGLALRDIDIAYRAEGVVEPIRLTVSDADLSAADPTNLSLKLNAKLAQGTRGGALTADATIKQLFDASGFLQAGNAVAQIKADLSDLPVDLLDSLAEQNGKLLALLGPVMNGHILADVTTTGGTASIEAISEHLNINSKVVFDESGVKNDGVSVIRLTLTPHAWTALSSVEGKSASVLASPVELAIELRELGLPLNDAGLDLAGISIDLGLAVGDTRLTIAGIGEVTLASTTGNVNTSRLGKTVTAGFNTTSSINRKPGGVNVSVELADLIDANNQINTTGLSASVNGQLTNAPIAAILDEMLPGVTYGLATRSLGPVVDATVNLSAAPRKDGKGMAGAFDLDLLTDGGEAGLQSALIGKFDLGEDAVQASLADGSFAKFRLTPGLIKAYQQATVADQNENAKAKVKAKPSDVSLGGPLAFRLDLTKASVRLLSGEEGYAPVPASIQLVGQLKSSKLLLNQNGDLAATLKGLLIDIATDGLTGDTTLALNANIDYPVTTGEEPKPGVIESKTTVHGLIDSTGQLAMDKASYQTATLIRQAPIDLVDAMFDMQGDLSGSVGPRAMLEASGSYTPSETNGSGGIDLTLKSRAASADMKLLMEAGRWKLKADAPLSFQVTPRLSQTMLKKVMPFLGSAVSARLPIGVTVKQEGFSAPVKDLGIAAIAANVQLELGELDLRGEGVLKKVLEQLGVGDRSLLNAKFSPVTINLTGGKLSYQGLTMGIDDVVLGFSGDVDLNTSRLDLKMTIPGSSLSNISFLKGRINTNQAIVIPLTGTFDQPTIDVKLLTGEIAKLALKGQIQDLAGGAIGGNKAGGQAGDTVGGKIGDKVGGEAGAVVGGLLNEILNGKKPTDTADTTATPAKDTAQTPASSDAEDAADETQLTEEERAARKERRRLRRERLEREQAERESQTQKP